MQDWAVENLAFYIGPDFVSFGASGTPLGSESPKAATCARCRERRRPCSTEQLALRPVPKPCPEGRHETGDA